MRRQRIRERAKANGNSRVRKRERDLERKQQDVELTVARKLDDEPIASSRKHRRAWPSKAFKGRRERATARRHAPAD